MNLCESQGFSACSSLTEQQKYVLLSGKLCMCVEDDELWFVSKTDGFSVRNQFQT